MLTPSLSPALLIFDARMHWAILETIVCSIVAASLAPTSVMFGARYTLVLN